MFGILPKLEIGFKVENVGQNRDLKKMHTKPYCALGNKCLHYKDHTLIIHIRTVITTTKLKDTKIYYTTL